MREYLKSLRQKSGLSQENVAHDLNISQQYYAFIESGERQKKMSLPIMMGLADVFSVPVNQIVEEESAYLQGIPEGLLTDGKDA